MKQNEITIKELFDTSRSIAGGLMTKYTYPWEVLPHIGEMVQEIGATLSKEEYKKVGNSIWIHRSVNIPPTVCIADNTIICEGAQIRHCAFIRGNAIIGAGAVVGNSCELKNVILFDGVQVPHYNYVGDSVLGFMSHLGAGAITSNVKSDKKNINIHAEDGEIETGLRKVGAFVGDNVEVGCGSVLNPGSVVGKGTNVYPLSSVRGCVAAQSIYKNQGEVVEKLEGPHIVK